MRTVCDGNTAGTRYMTNSHLAAAFPSPGTQLLPGRSACRFAQQNLPRFPQCLIQLLDLFRGVLLDVVLVVRSLAAFATEEQALFLTNVILNDLGGRLP